MEQTQKIYWPSLRYTIISQASKNISNDLIFKSI